MPTVSVILPTHTRATLLKTAIASVLAQTYGDFELLVIDDASTDDTPAVLAQVPDARLRVVSTTAAHGDAAARNVGLAHAQGRYLAFLDDDDAWMPEKLAMQVATMETAPPALGGVCTGHYVVTGARDVPEQRQVPAAVPLAHTNFIVTSSLLVRQTCLRRVGRFDERMPTSSDYDMWLRIAQAGFTFGRLDAPLVAYRQHAASLTGNVAKMIQGKERLFAKHDAHFRAFPQAYSRELLALGVLYCYAGQMGHGRRAFLRAMRLYPWNLRHYYNFALSLTGAARFQALKAAKEQAFA